MRRNEKAIGAAVGGLTFIFQALFDLGPGGSCYTAPHRVEGKSGLLNAQTAEHMAIMFLRV